MALRINLYHEVLRAKRQEQYDPLKLSIMGLIIVAVGMAAWYFVQLKRTSDVKSALSAQTAEFNKLSPQQKAAEKKETDLNKQIDLAEKLTKRMEKRIYWAPLFGLILSTIPENAQLTKLTCDTGREKGGISQMNIEGIAADLEPRALAEEIRKTIAERIASKYPNATASFRNLDDSAEHLLVKGRRLSAVIFNINVTFRTEAEPVPTPAVPKRAAKTDTAAL